MNPWADHLPRLLAPMGILTHRADSAREAGSVIRSVRVHVAVVDLGLPTEPTPQQPGGKIDEDGGLRLLELLARDSHRPPTVAVKRSRSGRDDAREINRALRAGAFAVVDQPTDGRGLELMLEVLRRCLIRHYAGIWPGSKPGEGPMA